VLVNVITKSVVPPALIVEGEKDLAIVGRLGVIVSKSATVQVPEVHATLVLLTPDGTEIVAVFTTCVCAKEGIWNASKKTNSHRPLKSVPAECNPNMYVFRRLNTFFLLISKKLHLYLMTQLDKTLKFTEINP
jgi:hypothetical protein